MRKRFALLLFWLGISLNGWAQQTPPAFLAYNQQNQPVTTICVNDPITFKDNTTRSQDPLFADFYFINNQRIEQPFVFAAPGKYAVTQLANGFDQRVVEFEVKANAPASPPVLQKLSLVPNGLQLQVQSSGVNDLIVEQASSPAGLFTPLETIRNVPQGSSQHQINTSSRAGCYRLRVTNTCVEQVLFTSNVVCSQTLSVSAGDRQNVLSWSPNLSPGSVVNYQLLRGGQPYQNLTAAQATYIDEQVACGRKYTYQLIALLQNGSQSASLPVEVETLGTTLPAAPLLIVGFDLQNRVTLETVVPAQETFKEQTLFRSQNGGSFSQISEKQPKTTVDPSAVNLGAALCYQAAYTDSCNLVSPRSNAACPAILTATLQPEGGVQLTWSSYQGFPSGIGSQTLELLDDQGQVYWSTQVTGQSYLDAQPQERFQRLTYRLTTSALNAPFQSSSNTAAIDQAFRFHFPTAFSPNNDGLNDVFRPVGAPFASTFTLQVLNRWGQIIYESKDPKAGWNGEYGGKPAPPETYIYRMEAVDVNGKKITQKGTITLIR